MSAQFHNSHNAIHDDWVEMCSVTGLKNDTHTYRSRSNVIQRWINMINWTISIQKSMLFPNGIYWMDMFDRQTTSCNFYNSSRTIPKQTATISNFPKTATLINVQMHIVKIEFYLISVSFAHTITTTTKSPLHIKKILINLWFVCSIENISKAFSQNTRKKKML